MNSKAPRNLSAKTPETKKYFFLVAGTVFFYPKGKPDDVGSLNTNAIISNDTGQIPVSSLADAQRGLAQAMVDRIGQENPVELVDVQVVNISKLGHMLPSEFHDVVEAQPQMTQEDVAPAKVI